MARIVHLSFWSLLLVSSAAQSCEDQLQLSGNNRKAVIFSDDCFLPSSDTYTPILLPPSVGYFSEKDQYFMSLADEHMSPELKACKNEEDVFRLISDHEKEQEEKFLSHLKFSDRMKLAPHMKAIDQYFSLYHIINMTDLYADEAMEIMDHHQSQFFPRLNGQEHSASSKADLPIIQASSVYKHIVLPVAAHYGFQSNSILPLVGEPRLMYLNKRGSLLFRLETVNGIALNIAKKDVQKTSFTFNDKAVLHSMYVHECGGHGISGDILKIGYAKNFFWERPKKYAKLQVAQEQKADINGILNPIVLAKNQGWAEAQRKMLYFGGILHHAGNMQKFSEKNPVFQDTTHDPNLETNWELFGSAKTDQTHPPDGTRVMVFKKLWDILTSKQMSHRLLDFLEK
ncbi:hypothetical protein IPH25_01865 [bacterium]|nr:MAG: hypothetical protein IPG37_03995 [bacterium]QQR62172.1 MAG: hypothetical protein IPH25_01865 [bacterium]QQR63270.1 MAG: hypothetical protein IPH67_02235 [bacterium]